MPNPGQVNNPSGVNSFNSFAPEPAYGQVTQEKQLADAAPLAGGKVAAGNLAAGKRAQRQSQKPRATQPQQEQAPQPVPSPPQQPSTAQTWTEIAASPGAENHPVIAQMAALAGAAV